MKAFFPSQFVSCTLTWMFHGRKLKHRLHERCFCIVYHDTTSSSEEILQKDNSVLIHYKNIQVLAIEFLRVYKDISPKIMTEVFLLSQPMNYSIRHLISQQDQLTL